MRKKRKVPVVRAWRLRHRFIDMHDDPKLEHWRALKVGRVLWLYGLRAMESEQWAEADCGAVSASKEYDGNPDVYIELPPAEARRLNEKRLKAMKARKP